MRAIPVNFTLIALVFLIPLLVSVSVKAQTYNLEKVIDSQVAIPGGFGTFDRFTLPIVINDNEDIAFQGHTAEAAGLYIYLDGNLILLADENTPIPMGSGTFRRFSNPVYISDEEVAFIGFGHDLNGIFSYLDGTIENIVSTNTEIPMTNETFEIFQDPISLGSGNLVFQAEGSDTHGIYIVINDILSKVADTNTEVPMGTGNFENILNHLPLGNGDLLFRGTGLNQEGLYKAVKDVSPNTLTIVKQTIPNASVESTFIGTDFTEGCSLEGEFVLGVDRDSITCELPAGTYTVQESPITPGYDLTDIDCTGASSFSETADSVTVDLMEGEEVICTFTNTFIPSIVLDPLDPSHVGVQNTLRAKDSTPGGDVTFIYGFTEDTVATDDICAGLEAGILNPRILTTIPADESGVAELNVNVPLDFVDITVVIQAIDVTACQGSNVNTETLINPPLADPPTLLPLDPSHVGVPNTLAATHASPGGDVTFIYGFSEDTVAADDICPGLEAGIFNPRILTTITADERGFAELNVNVPTDLAGVTVVVQAVDITTCQGSNVNTETLIDPLIPPSPLNLLPIDPGTAGVENIFRATGATPGSTVTFIFGTALGDDPSDEICSGYVSPITDPQVIGSAIADDSDGGVATLILTIPVEFAGMDTFLQAVDIATCSGSNVNSESL